MKSLAGCGMTNVTRRWGSNNIAGAYESNTRTTKICSRSRLNMKLSISRKGDSARRGKESFNCKSISEDISSATSTAVPDADRIPNVKEDFFAWDRADWAAGYRSQHREFSYCLTSASSDDVIGNIPDDLVGALVIYTMIL